MRVLLLLSTALLAAASAAAGANIDNGFAQDGVTTYCQGVNGPRGSPLEFNALEAHNAGRCPIDVKLELKATTVGTQSPMEVQWAASVRAGDVPGNIFPRAVDAVTKTPQPVIASLLRACKAGTNCAPDGVVVPQVVGDGAETGAFDAQGRRPLRPYKFQFRDPGHYVVVGVVTLPGDSALNVSATEFLAFQRVTVVEGVGPATVSPPTNSVKAPTNEVGGEAKTSNINFQDSLVKSATTTSPPAAATSDQQLRGSAGVDASFSGNNKSADAAAGADATSGGGNLNTMLVIGAVAVVMVAVLMYFVVVRKKSRTVQGKDNKRPLDPHSEAGIFRLSHGGGHGDDMASSLSMAPLPNKKQFASGSSSVYSGSSSERSLAPPRYTTSSQSSSVISSDSTDSGPFSRATRPQHSEFPSYENAALAASGKEFQPGKHHKKAQRVSVASSGFSAYGNDDDDQDVGTFGDLHDSAEHMPVVERKKSRPSVASSYGEYDEQRASSRLYLSEASRGASEYSSGGYSDRASEYSSSLGERRSTELGALSERGTRLGEYEV